MVILTVHPISLALALIQFPYLSRQDQSSRQIVQFILLHVDLLVRLKKLKLNDNLNLLAYRIFNKLWTFAPFCLA